MIKDIKMEAKFYLDSRGDMRLIVKSDEYGSKEIVIPMNQIAKSDSPVLLNNLLTDACKMVGAHSCFIRDVSHVVKSNFEHTRGNAKIVSILTDPEQVWQTK